jgi:MFS-type transporter involved in bile tolerance (Atg22 family)
MVIPAVIVTVVIMVFATPTIVFTSVFLTFVAIAVMAPIKTVITIPVMAVVIAVMAIPIMAAVSDGLDRAIAKGRGEDQLVPKAS